MNSDPLYLYDINSFFIVNVFFTIAINSKIKLGLSFAKLSTD